ncbi:MAG: SRPBCC family protein [Anaerolineae bacterium]
MIDQRILITAPADAVWLHLTAPASMPKWNRCARQMSIISTHAVGVGARRRCVDDDNRTTVEEITAWLENIGYEYKMIDGPFRKLKGRLRLQAVADGTIVNWIVEYELKGILAGARNALSFRRHYTNMMAESLRDLRKLVEKSGIQFDPEKQARFGMQADPGVEARAARAASMAEVAISTESGGKVPVRAERIVLPPDERPKTETPTPAASVAAMQAVEIDNGNLDDVWSDIPPEAAVVGLSAEKILATALKSNPQILHAFTPPKPDPIAAAPILPTPTIPEPDAHSADTPSSGMRPVTIVEPPLDQEDTRPRKAVQSADNLPAVVLPETPLTETPLPEEPDLAEDTPESYKAMTVPISLVAPPVTPAPPKAPMPVTQTIEVIPPEGSTPTPSPTGSAAATPIPATEPPTSLPERVPTPPAINLDQLRARAQALAADSNSNTAPGFDPEAANGGLLPPQTDQQDTGQISIWEIFGVESRRSAVWWR